VGHNIGPVLSRNGSRRCRRSKLRAASSPSGKIGTSSTPRCLALHWIQRTAPFLHHIYFNFLEVVAIVRTDNAARGSKYRKILEDLQPDILLSVHDSLNHAFFKYAVRYWA